MIRKKGNEEIGIINTPEDYFNRRNYTERMMFEKKKKDLIKKFFLFWSVIIILFLTIALYYHFLGILIFIVPLFLTYVRISHNNDKWKENFDMIMSNNIARLFAYTIYSICLIFLIVVIYKFLKINFKIDLEFMDKLIDFLLLILSKH